MSEDKPMWYKSSTCKRPRIHHPDPVVRADAESILAYGPFELFFTLTFRNFTTRAQGHSSTRAYCFQIGKRMEKAHVRVIIAGGPQSDDGCDHRHILAAREDGSAFRTSIKEFEKLWVYGDFKIEPVRDQIKSAVYMASQAYWVEAMICDRELPCRRRGRCKKGGAWPSLGDYVER